MIVKVNEWELMRAVTWEPITAHESRRVRVIGDAYAKETTTIAFESGWERIRVCTPTDSFSRVIICPANVLNRWLAPFQCSFRLNFVHCKMDSCSWLLLDCRWWRLRVHISLLLFWWDVSCSIVRSVVQLTRLIRTVNTRRDRSYGPWPKETEIESG